MELQASPEPPGPQGILAQAVRRAHLASLAQVGYQALPDFPVIREPAEQAALLAFQV